ncbi:MAG: amino acid kinase family protein [Gammaproteobacteria bacterium]
MLIVKLGGSLVKSQSLGRCLDVVDSKYRNREVAIVPGGGAFADQVRIAQKEWRFDDDTAHRMALLAMQQMALLFRGLKPHFVIASASESVRSLTDLGKTVIWSPSLTELDNAGIRSNWDVTSDSLAAWLANELSAEELILVKSAPVKTGVSPVEMMGRHIVDKAFIDFAARSVYKITIINHERF